MKSKTVIICEKCQRQISQVIQHDSVGNLVIERLCECGIKTTTFTKSDKWKQQK